MKNRTYNSDAEHMAHIRQKNLVFNVKQYLKKITKAIIFVGALILINELLNLI